MSEKEEFKYETIKKLISTNGNKNRAAIILGCSKRHINRLINSYSKNGKASFAHGNKDKKPANALSIDVITTIITLFKEKYYDFNFKHFHEKLIKNENIFCSYPTVVNILYSHGIISHKSHRKTKRAMKKAIKTSDISKENSLKLSVELAINPKEAHPRKPRSKYFGEIIQMDASHEVWFGNEKTHLHVAIDDSTGKIVGAYFDKQETLNGYYQVTAQILSKYGIPAKFLTDRRTVFEYKKLNESNIEKDNSTQFGYACNQLGIEIETTSVPQAKGRVERVFGTLQSRLRAELRLSNVQEINLANDFLVEYINEFNKEFSIDLNSTRNVFESKVKSEEINLYLSTLCERTVDKGHCVQYNHKYYFVLNHKGVPIYLKPKTKVTVLKSLNGNLYAIINGKTYDLLALETHMPISKTFDLEEVEKLPKKIYIPPMSHPWKGKSFNAYLEKLEKKTNKEYPRVEM
ncbi:MAG: ISNCY family transposase [Cetobacterium sp.]|uniref:ISNCY family transposase n=1 Tax=Cetobacterium sp. TaxID=2071632 RepID=UPI003EE5B9DE